MRRTILSPVVFAFLVHHGIRKSNAQESCSGSTLNYETPSKGRCIDFAPGTHEYPAAFGNVLNEVVSYKCETSDLRVIISNGIPDHKIVQANPNKACEINYAIVIPLNPEIAEVRTEIPVRGPIAVSRNGVPAYGAHEANNAGNVVEPDANSIVQDGGFWYGHASKNNAWHVHNQCMGQSPPMDHGNMTFMGYAMDGFPILAPLHPKDVSRYLQLDDCNGMLSNQGYENSKPPTYAYHTRISDAVNENSPYCKADGSPENNWNYILGCYSGSVERSGIFDATTYQLPEDCVVEVTGKIKRSVNSGGINPTTMQGTTTVGNNIRGGGKSTKGSTMTDKKSSSKKAKKGGSKSGKGKQSSSPTTSKNNGSVMMMTQGDTTVMTQQNLSMDGNMNKKTSMKKQNKKGTSKGTTGRAGLNRRRQRRPKRGGKNQRR